MSGAADLLVCRTRTGIRPGQVPALECQLEGAVSDLNLAAHLTRFASWDEYFMKPVYGLAGHDRRRKNVISLGSSGKDVRSITSSQLLLHLRWSISTCHGSPCGPSCEG